MLRLTTQAAYELPIGRRMADLTGRNPRDRLSEKIELAVHEAVANAVIHGNLGIPGLRECGGLAPFNARLAARIRNAELLARRITIRADWTPTDILIGITDQGDGFRPPSGPEELCESQPDSLTGGRGLFLIFSLTDQVEFDRGGREIRLRFHRIPPAQAPC